MCAFEDLGSVSSVMGLPPDQSDEVEGLTRNRHMVRGCQGRSWVLSFQNIEREGESFREDAD